MTMRIPMQRSRCLFTGNQTRLNNNHLSIPSAHRPNTFSQQSRSYSSTQGGASVTVISGASSAVMGRSLVFESRSQGPDHHVIGLTTRDMSSFNTPGVRFAQISKEDIDKPEKVAQVVEKAISKLSIDKPITKITADNLIGGSTAPQGKTLEYLNRDLPIAFLEGVTLVAGNMDAVESLAFGHVSSIAASINSDICDYARIKEATDNMILNLAEKVGASATILRPGIIMPDRSSTGLVDMGHAYSPEQFANIPIIPIVGSGNQVQQPISAECLAKALVAGTNTTERHIINAVGDKSMSQKQLFLYFSKYDKVVFVHLNKEFLGHLAANAPMGRLAPYSVRMLHRLDNDAEKNIPFCHLDFSKLLPGKKAKTIEEMYPRNGEIITKKPPIGQHLFNIMEKTIISPKFIIDLMSTLPKGLEFSVVENVKGL